MAPTALGPLVSVIIPTYDDRAFFLQRALASVYAQDGVGEQFDMEVIVVDNASSSATQKVVRRQPEIRYLRLETNRGLWPAMNIGLRAATGKYVAFLIDDDLWLSHKLSLQVPILEANAEVSVVYGQQIVVFGEHVYVWPGRDAPSGSVFRALLMGNVVGDRAVLIRRDAFEKAGYFDESLSAYGDYDMWLRLAFHFSFAFVPGPVGVYLRSIRGLYSADIGGGRTEVEYPLVLERALAMLPDISEDAAQVRREARARAALILADEQESVGELGRMRWHLLRALAEFPWIAGKPWAQSSIVRHVSRFALASVSPVEAVRAFCADVMAGMNATCLRDRIQVRRLLANVWAHVAIALARNGSAYGREAGWAATCAVLQNPAKLRSTALLLLMFRTAFGFRRTPSRNS
jgi:hypothetical protein